MKRRRRASEAERSAKASSIWPSIALSAPPRRPISVVPPSGSTRRERSPAPIAAAVSSMRRSGRRLAVISHSPSTTVLAMTAPATSSSISLSWSSVSSVSSAARRGSASPSRERQSAARAGGSAIRRSAARTVDAGAAPSADGPKPRRDCGGAAPSRLAARACRCSREPSVRVADLDVHAGGEHAEPARGGRSAAAPGQGRPRVASEPRRRSRCVSSELSTRSKSERAQRRVGRDVGRQQAGRREHASTSSRRARSDIPRTAAPMRPPLRPPSRH